MFPPAPEILRSRLLPLACLLVSSVLCAAGSAGAAEPIGFVTEVRGEATALDASGNSRALRANAAIEAGDQIATGAGSELGLLLGTYYAGLDESTSVRVVGLQPNGAPTVELRRGHVRLIDGEGEGGAILDTPGLRIADAGADAEGFAFGEKSWLVSMACAQGGSALRGERVENGAPSGASLTVPSGDCVVAKPGEGLYAARGTHDPLGLLAGTPPPAADGLAGDPSSRFGQPLPPVAVGLPAPAPRMALTAPPSLIPALAAVGPQRLPCDVGGGLGCAPQAAGAVNPPINPPVPGGPPGLPIP